MDNQFDRVNAELSNVNKRLGVMISLLLRSVPGEEETLSFKGQVSILADLGMRPRDIASILGRTPTHVNKELTGLRKAKNKKK